MIAIREIERYDQITPSTVSTQLQLYSIERNSDSSSSVHGVGNKKGFSPWTRARPRPRLHKPRRPPRRFGVPRHGPCQWSPLATPDKVCRLGHGSCRRPQPHVSPEGSTHGRTRCRFWSLLPALKLLQSQLVVTPFTL